MRTRLVLALALLASPAAFAQQDTEAEQPKVKVVYPAVEEITFGEVQITAEQKKPASAFITGRHDEKFDSQIDERVHFKRDLAKSIRVNVKLVETTTK